MAVEMTIACGLQGTEFCDTAGFDTLAKRMREGRDACRCFVDFVRQRFVPLCVS